MKRRIKVFNTCIGRECRKADENDSSISILEAERELGIESLRAHLSEQRHDFFNLLQVLYGYTQLKKPDKVLAHIKDYCRQMENIGRLYNCKCIKLADLLYTKDKEAESIDMNLEVFADVSFDPVVRRLDEVAVLHAVDHAVSVFLYALDSKGLKNTHIHFDLKEKADCFQMEIYCREHREGQLEPISLTIPEQVIYWKKIARSVMCIDKITRHCTENGFEAGVLEDGLTFVLSIPKAI